MTREERRHYWKPLVDEQANIEKVNLFRANCVSIAHAVHHVVGVWPKELSRLGPGRRNSIGFFVGDPVIEGPNGEDERFYSGL